MMTVELQPICSKRSRFRNIAITTSETLSKATQCFTHGSITNGLMVSCSIPLPQENKHTKMTFEKTNEDLKHKYLFYKVVSTT